MNHYRFEMEIKKQVSMAHEKKYSQFYQMKTFTLHTHKKFHDFTHQKTAIITFTNSYWVSPKQFLSEII